jgi:hypothetical protein
MEKSSTFSKDFKQIQNSKTTYAVKIDPKTLDTHYDDKTKTITYNPTDALKVKNGIQSPAMGFGHEIDHAARDDENHSQFIKDQATPVESGGVKTIDGVETAITLFSDSPDELKAMSAEKQMANELHEPTRSSHSEGEHVKVGDPSKHCTNTSTNHCN